MLRPDKLGQNLGRAPVEATLCDSLVQPELEGPGVGRVKSSDGGAAQFGLSP